MSCKCIEKAEKRLAKETGDPEARIVTGFRIGIKDNVNFVKMYIPIPCIFRPKKKDGSFGQRKKDHHMIGAYCPFCGKEINKGD